MPGRHYCRERAPAPALVLILEMAPGGRQVGRKKFMANRVVYCIHFSSLSRAIRSCLSRSLLMRQEGSPPSGGRWPTTRYSPGGAPETRVALRKLIVWPTLNLCSSTLGPLASRLAIGTRLPSGDFVQA